MLKFRINGIPVAVQPVFWIIAVLLGFGTFNGVELAVWVGIVFVSILIHELGHAFTAQWFGRSPQVTLLAFGGVTSWAAVPELSPARRILVTLAGPGSGFALAGIAWLAWEYGGVADGGTLARLAVGVTIWVNLLWGVFNLIPIRGLDGGQTVAGILEWVWPARARVASEVVYVVCGIGAAVFGFLSGYYLLAIFALFLTFSGMPLLGRGRRRERAEPPAPPQPQRHPSGDSDGEPPLLGI